MNLFSFLNLFSFFSAFARVRSLESFQAVFATPGYGICESAELETGWDKIAVFANAAGTPTHVARQLANGHWTDKPGRAEDIEHKLRDLTIA